MPLYSDPGYYYGGSSSYSPYYSSNPYASYAGYSRALAGTYVVPTSRTSSHITSSSSRYKPKLTSISELPLASRGLTSLTRIQSPKISYHSLAPKYIPPRPIPINAADIDVSASRYPKHEHYIAPVAVQNSSSKDISSDLNNNSNNNNSSDSSDFMPRVDGADPSQNRSTIKRDRAVIRLSIMRSRSRDQVKNEKGGDSDRPAVSNYTPVESTPINTEKPQKSSWRDNFGEDLFPRTKDFTRKTPGELLLERHIIRDKQDTFKFADLSKENKESDALLTVDSIRRLSLTKCPSFHEICEDISSDKIDDDLNAGELRRRASLIQEQEIEIFNELQKSGSGLIQYILERNESKDDCRKSVKRKSKRSKKIRHKITATVHIDDASAAPLTVIPIPEEPSPTQVSPPKIIFSVDEIEEDHMVNTVVVLPKKKKPKVISEEPKKCEKDPIAEEVKPLEEQSRSASEKDKTEKMPQIIVKSDSVVNVTLEINKKTKPKIFDDSESKISEKKPSPEKQIDEGISLRKLSPEKITAEKILAKKVSPEKMEAEKKPSIKKLSAEKTDVDETKTVVKKLNLEKKNEDSEAKKSSPVTKTISAKDLKKPTDISSLEVKTAVDVERSKSLPPATLQDNTPAVPISSRNSLVEGKALSVSKLEPEKKANLEKESSAENKNEAQTQKSSEKPKSVSQIKELFGKDKIVGSKDSNLTNKNEVKPKVKELSPEKKIGLKDKAAIFEVKKETTAGKFPLKSTIKETSPEKKIANISFEAKIKDQEPDKKNDFLNKISVANKAGAAPSIAKPKPIVKLQRSDSGEDFWGQIGSRETLYMDKRKQKVVVSQWEKREHLLEDRDLENITDAKSIQTMKDKLGMQKIEALKEATLSSTKTDVRRSISNASALQKPEIIQKLPSILTSKSPATVKSVEPKEKLPIDQSAATKPSNKSDNIDVKATCDKKISPDRLPLKIEENLTTSTTTTNKTQNDKIDGPTPLTSIRSTSAETQPTPSSTLLPRNATAAPAAAAAPASNASDDRSAPKINVGLAAKSPETKIKQQTNKLLKDSGQKTDRTPTEDKYKDPINLSKATTPTTTSTSVATPKPSTAITPAKKGDHQQKCSALIESGRVANAAEKKDTGLNALPAGTPPQTKSPLSPSTIQTSATNSNNGGQHDNDKISTIEIGSPKENKTTRSGSENSPQQRSNEQKQLPAVAPVLVQSGGGVTAINRIEESGTKNAIIDADRDDVIANRSATALQPTKDDSRDSSDSTISKIRTVSDLNRCLIDVDAELSDYYPSDQSSDEDVNTSECSSCQGDSNRYSRSMKKKEKHRHHNQQKKKDKDANKFDPNKKVKLDHTKKCYVKDEPAPYPLIATPRPLWKREKITYPQDSSSDSEETESDSECSTSEDECSGDDLTTTTAKNDASTSLNATSDIRMSTCSNDSGFEGGTAPTSPKKMLETSYTYAQFQRSGRITAPATIIPRFKKYSVDDFHFLAVLGKGSFGKVLLAELRNTDYCYAVKCLKKDVVLEDDDVECTLIERKVLAMGTQHPYLCHLFCTFQTESHLFFVMEYLNGGDLMFHIQQSGRFPEPRARFYAAEIISGLKFLHKKGIIYRDLKLDNVLLDFDGHVRIADFGMCKLKIYLDNTADSFCGTPDYMAPEVIKGDKYNQNVDWWSFGVLLYEMLIGQSPFSGCDEDELFWSICNEMPWIPKYISDQAMSILKGLLEKDANFRIGSIHSPAGDICDQAFFKEIDWNRLNRRAIDPPFKPQVKHPLDTKYFDKTFTRERVRLTPIDKEILQSMDQVPFQGFSYTNPNATLN